MKAIIMAGGEGSRLRPLTCDMPKPMARLCGKPIIEYILDLLNKHNTKEAAVTLRYLPALITEHFESGSYKDMSLSFAEEKDPLGTAGGVKNASKQMQYDDLLIISGDALCDTDLTEAYRFHNQKGADATIVVKRVEDPREYGLVSFDGDGTVVGFVEKPGWSQASTNAANTGIYILSEGAVNLIPDNTPFDFAKDLFPLMMSKGMKICAFEDNSYWCDIGDLTTYLSCQADILTGVVKTEMQFPEQTYENAEITGPVYIGDNVQIGQGAIIGPNTILEDNAVVGRGAKIRNSIVLSGAFIGDNASLTGAIVCPNASVKQHAAMFEGSILGTGGMIGKNAQVKPSVKIWPGKQIEDNQIVSDHIQYGIPRVSLFDDDGITGEAGVDLTPLLCVKIGAATGSVKGSSKIGIAGVGGRSAKAFKLALMSGALGAGAQVWDFGDIILPQLTFAVSFCGLSAGIFISGGPTCCLTILGEGGLPLTRSVEREMEGYFFKDEYKRASWDNYKEVVDMSGIKLLYQQELFRYAPHGLSEMQAMVSCENSEAARVFEDTLSRLGCDTSLGPVFRLSDDGRTLTITDTDGKEIEEDKVLTLCCVIDFMSGKDVALPYGSPRIIDSLAEKYGCKAERFLQCPADNSDQSARRMSRTQLWLNDGIMAALKIMSHMKAEHKTLSEMMALIPSFATVVKSIEIDTPPSELLGSLNDAAAAQASEGVIIYREHGCLLIRPTKAGKSLKIFSEARDAETAKDLCSEIIDMLDSSKNK